MADPKNKWTQPAAPPAPMFFGKKERDLVKQVNDELAERVVGQPIAYYPISIEESNFNDVYGEAIEKVSLPPVRVYAYVEVDNEQTNDRYGYEYRSSLTVNFNRKRLTEDQNLFVRVGDFIQYGEEFYEIVRTYNDTRYYFGQVEHKFQVSAECITARAGDFKVMPAISRSVDTTVLEDGSAAPAPRPAPYPPLEATYITVTANSKLPNERVLTAGSGITIDDAGAGNSITIASTAQSAAGSGAQLQLNAGSGNFGASANLTFLSGSSLLQVTGAVSATRVTASAMNITPVSGALAGAGSYLGLDANNNIIVTSSSGGGGGSGSGIFTELNGSQAYVTSSLTIGASSTPTSTMHIIGDVTASISLSSSILQSSYLTASFATISGSATFGVLPTDTVTINAETITLTNVAAGTDNTVLVYDGSSIVTDEIDSRVWGATLVDASGTPVDNQIGVWTDANTMEGTTGFTYDGTVALVTGSLTASVAISASTYYGDGSNLSGITTSPAGSNTQIQYNDSGAFAASSAFTFDGATVTGSFSGSLAELTTVSASALTVAGSTYLSGGLLHKRTAIATSYTASVMDYIVGVTAAPTSILFDATQFSDGQVVVVKDESGAASASDTITLVSSGSQTIDGSTTDVTIESPYGSVLLYSNGVNWFIY
tara:strand:- start:3767 stop:5737 length:1971 start_codon:yes stop_codon:yes gene_type:complete